MDTFRKWLNKPKADDKSLLARFYHADRSLTAVASELDSFDGRAEPDRCSRLVSRLRQGQDKVLSITNLIMEELIGDDRDPRAFRAKFPEEVLQENLAGQLWFGAECLAAGSSIMNREQESKEMRPLAQAVTKSLGNVRNLLRDQCLRNNVPNSKTLHLNINDSATEQLYESLKIFDRLFAEFELRYVSAMVQVKTKHEYEMQEYICVLFSETLQRALKIGLLEQDKVDAFDPALMFSIPRLAIICGLVIYQKGPLNMDMSADKLSEMFRPFRTILIKIRDLLRALDKNELHQLEKLLCTNEDIHLKSAVDNSIDAPPPPPQNNNKCGEVWNHNNNNNNNSNNNNSCDDDDDDDDDDAKKTVTEMEQPLQRAGSTLMTLENNNVVSAGEEPLLINGLTDGCGATAATTSCSSSSICAKDVFSGDREYTMYISSTSSSSSSSKASSTTSSPLVSPSPSPTPSDSITSSSPLSTSVPSSPDWTNDETRSHLAKELNIVSADCATGYLIPNTNFGNLLQPNEVPLTDNFVASEDDEFGSCNESSSGGSGRPIAAHDDETVASCLLQHASPLTRSSTNSSPRPSCSRMHTTDSSEESEQLTIKASSKSLDSCDGTVSNSQYTKLEKSSSTCSAGNGSARRYHRHHHPHHHHHRHHHQHHSTTASSGSGSSSNSSSAGSQSTSSDRHQYNHHHHHLHHHSSKKRSSLGSNTSGNDNSCEKQQTHHDTSTGDTLSSLSDGDPHEVTLALRAAGRLKFKSTENLLHRLFVCIAGVADQLQTNFASDLRQILRSVFLMNMSPPQEEITIPEKTKDSELFEFRASENDVIQQSAGSNQSIYSAEEVNPELDNVFNNSSSSASGGDRQRTVVAGIQRGHTIDLGTVATTTATTLTTTPTNRSNISRSRSLGEQESSTPTAGNRCLSSYIRERRLSSPQRNSHRDDNSVGSNSPPNSSASNSPISDRLATAQIPHHIHNDDIVDRNHHNYHHHLHQHQHQHLHHQSTTAVSNNSFSQSSNNSDGGTTTPPTHQSAIRLSPPAWIPDDKAPRCMSCTTPFTAFRRRHHCRNCGGVFCGVCSNSSAPLPKYGLTKAVRVCRDCLVHHLTTTVTS